MPNVSKLDRPRSFTHMASFNHPQKLQHATIAEHIAAIQKAESERFNQETREKRAKEWVGFEERLKQELKELELRLEEERRKAAAEKERQEVDMQEVGEGSRPSNRRVQPVGAQRQVENTGNTQKGTNSRNLKRKREREESEESEMSGGHGESEEILASKGRNDGKSGGKGPAPLTQGVFENQDRCQLCIEVGADCYPSEG